jgi:hypothetical protein
MKEDPIVSLIKLKDDLFVIGESTVEVDQGWIDTFGEPDKPYYLVGDPRLRATSDWPRCI